MGCCQSSRLDSEVQSQLNTLEEGDTSDKFKEVPLSSSQSPLKFSLFQEEHNLTIRTSYETMSSCNNPRVSLELAFVCSKP
jgi:hypothetical protein